MLLEKNFNIISPIPKIILHPIIENCLKANWEDGTYERFGPSYGIQPVIKQKTLRFPNFLISEKTKNYSLEHKELLISTQPLLNWILSLPIFKDHVFLQGQISTLMPGIELDWHVDLRWYHAYGHRLHVPIVTNNKCVHTWENEECHMDVGYLYDLNNRVLHSAKNCGENFRTHIILDLVPEAKFKEAQKQGINPLSLVPYTDISKNNLDHLCITSEQIINLIAYGSWNNYDLDNFLESIRYCRQNMNQKNS